MVYKCVCCKNVIRGTIFSSSLYGSGRSADLCQGCHDEEENEIEVEGTNDLPHRLATYSNQE